MSTTKIQPGGDLHLTVLMARHSLNFVTGTERAALLAYGRDVFTAGAAHAAAAGPATPVQVQALYRARRALHAIGKTYDDSELRTRALEADEEIGRILAAAPQAPAAPAVDAMWPLPGDLVRYGEGVTALALLGAPHARGWHSEQCMGGHVYHTDSYRPTDTDRRMWATCAVEWRGKTMAEARREAGLPSFPLVNPIPQAKPEC